MTTMQERAKRIYGSGSGHDYRHALESHYTKREIKARAKGDKQGLETSSAERKALAKFARERGMSAQDLHEALSILAERDDFPLSKETLEKKRPGTLEEIRLDRGDAIAAKAHVEKFLKFTSDLAKEIPSLAERASATGAVEDRRLIDIGARYAEPVVLKQGDA